MNDDGLQREAEQRQDARCTLEIPASVRRRGASQIPATLYDLSCGGCRMTGVSLKPSRHDDVFVRIPGLESLATRVCWTGDGKSGLTFERRLHPAVFQRLVSLHGQGTTPGPALSWSAPAQTTQPPSRRPGGSRRERILGGHIAPAPGLLLDKQPADGGKSILTLVRRLSPRWANHRLEPRHAAPDDASFAVGPHGRPAEIANISRSGIMATGVVGQGIGETIEVRFAGCEPISGTVIWKRGEQFGLALPPDSILLAEAG